ncbi:MAG: apolipoprotein N-acyltransferase [Gammaproteobacteria bacterium]
MSSLKDHYRYSRSLLAGMLYTLSFSPYDYWWFAPFALALLGEDCSNSSPGRAFLRGCLFGLGMFGLGVSWVFVSIHHFGGAPLAISILLTGVFIAFWAAFPGFAALLAAIIPARTENHRILAFPLLWMLIEYVRGYWVLDGFPWLQIAYSQMDGPLAGYIPLVGSYGTGLSVCMSASLLLLFFRNGNQRVLIASILMILWASGWILKSHRWTQSIGKPIQVVLIQGNISQDQKWRPEFRQSTLRRYRAMTEQHWGADVIVWPETAIPAWLDEVKDNFIVPLSREAKRRDTDLIISVPARGSSKEEKFNAVISLGTNEEMYRKVHLLPFGEYLPWQPWSAAILKNLKIKLGQFSPGADRQPLLKAGGYPFITSICYEDVFSDRAIVGLPEGAYLVNVTNDGWFGDSIEPYQHMQLARMRASETGRYLLRATNTGLTGIVAPDGKITHQAPLFKTAALTGEISPMGGMTPYAKTGDGPIIFFIAMALCSMAVIGKRASRQQNA